MPVAIITGASRGLGRALAGTLAERGWDLVIDARSAGALKQAEGSWRNARGWPRCPVTSPIRGTGWTWSRRPGSSAGWTCW